MYFFYKVLIEFFTTKHSNLTKTHKIAYYKHHNILVISIEINNI